MFDKIKEPGDTKLECHARMSANTLKASPDAQSFKLICRNTIIFIPS